MSEELWKGVQLKLKHAQYHREQMNISIDSSRWRRESALYEGHGTALGHDWQLPFYANLDAFLTCTRSIPEITNFCFGRDIPIQQLKEWFERLPLKEKMRRVEFSDRFARTYNEFRKLPLSDARNVSVHRKGHPPVTVATIGRWGTRYKSGPTDQLPSHEVPPSDGSNMGWFGQSARILPSWKDYFIGSENLFEACNDYFEQAKRAVYEAETLVRDIHRDLPLTPPPG